MTLRIVSLAAAPEHSEQVVEWLWQAFGNENSQAFFTSVIESSLRSGDFPLTFIALEGDQLLGTVGVWRCDLISRQDLFPWLAALYIDEAHRGRGLSQQLQQHVIDWCRQQGYRDLWLYSACAGYYERFGWRYVGEALDYPDIPVRLYHQQLAD